MYFYSFYHNYLSLVGTSYVVPSSNADTGKLSATNGFFPVGWAGVLYSAVSDASIHEAYLRSQILAGDISSGIWSQKGFSSL